MSDHDGLERLITIGWNQRSRSPGTRKQSRLLDRSAEFYRSEVLERLAELRRELSEMIDESEPRRGETDKLAMAQSLVADGCAIVMPIVTSLGGKLLLVTAGPDCPALTQIDLPKLTTGRLNMLLHSDTTLDDGWLPAFVGDGTRWEPKQGSARSVERIARDLWDLFAEALASALKELGITPGSRLMFLPSASLNLLPLGLAQETSSGRRLIDDYEIVYAPSLTALAKALQQVELTVSPSLAIVNLTDDVAATSIEKTLVAALFGDHTCLVLREHTTRPGVVMAALKARS
jgi:hypothetical protein